MSQEFWYIAGYIVAGVIGLFVLYVVGRLIVWTFQNDWDLRDKRRRRDYQFKHKRGKWYEH